MLQHFAVKSAEVMDIFTQYVYFVTVQLNS